MIIIIIVVIIIYLNNNNIYIIGYYINIEHIHTYAIMA
jgi:hypothetical protein